MSSSKDRGPQSTGRLGLHIDRSASVLEMFWHLVKVQDYLFSGSS